jgi:hypothetical protein
VADGLPLRRLGVLSGANLFAAYRAADVFVLPTLEDNLPNTMIESVAAGTPVVGYATGGVVDVVGSGACGVVVECGDVGALSAALADLILDDTRRALLRRRCEAYARTHLTLASQACAYTALYSELLGRRRTSQQPSSSSHVITALQHHEAELDSTLQANRSGASQRHADPNHGPMERLDFPAVRVISRLGTQLLEMRADLARLQGELESVHHRWRETRETLHDVGRQLRARVEQGAAERAAEQLVRTAERRVLRITSRRLMKRVAIYGAGDAGRRAWEALARCGSVDIVGFVADHASGGKTLLGSPVHPLSWATPERADLVAVASVEPEGAVNALVGAGVGQPRLVILPMSADDNALSEFVTRRFPDPLAAILSSAPPGTALRVGIFGTGAAGLKVWEALAEIDTVETAWFADNNAAQHGRALLWVDVIAPARVPECGVDAIVIGSMARQPIREQLLGLGIRDQRILTPDVQATVDEIRQQLALSLRRIAQERVAA